VGETVKMDDKGRVTIVLKVLENRNKLVDKVKALKLAGDKGRAHTDAATVKDFYGGLKH